MLTVHASIVYSPDKARLLQNFTRDTLAKYLKRDLTALEIPHPESNNIALEGNEIHFWWTTAHSDFDASVSIVRAMDMWIHSEAFRDMQSKMGIDNILLLHHPRKSATYSSCTASSTARSSSPRVGLPVQCGIRTPPELRRSRTAPEYHTTTSAETLLKIKKPQHFRQISNSPPKAEWTQSWEPRPKKDEVENSFLLTRKEQSLSILARPEMRRVKTISAVDTSATIAKIKKPQRFRQPSNHTRIKEENEN